MTSAQARGPRPRRRSYRPRLVAAPPNQSDRATASGAAGDGGAGTVADGSPWDSTGTLVEALLSGTGDIQPALSRSPIGEFAARYGWGGPVLVMGRRLRAPSLIGPGPALSWLPSVLDTLAWRIMVDAFGAATPPRTMTVPDLARFVLEEASYPQRDQVWAEVVRVCRHRPTRGVFSVVALALAAPGLLSYRNRIDVANPTDVHDIDADLSYGLLRRVQTIDLTRPNVGGRLIDQAIDSTARRLHQHTSRPQPLDLDTLPGHDARLARPAPGGLQAALNGVTAHLAAAGRPLHPDDITLIAMTRIDGAALHDAAANLDLTTAAAYKRRQRAEARIAAVLAQQ